MRLQWPAYRSRDRHFQDVQRPQGRDVHGVEEAAQVVELGGFPEEAAADVQGIDGGAALQRLAEEDGAVEAAADEDGEAGRIGGGCGSGVICAYCTRGVGFQAIHGRTLTVGR